MKIVYSRLQFELTRRCNQNCNHCCRGESQNLDLSKDVVDTFFDKNDIHSINHLMFSGGEPTLNGKMLEYIVDKIISKNIPVFWFELSINGLSYSEELVRGLNKLNEYCKNFSNTSSLHRYGGLLVSQTQYHKEAKNDVLEKFSQLPYFIPPNGIDYISSEYLLPYGNALKNRLSSSVQELSGLMDYESSIKITEFNGDNFLVCNYHYISSNGNLLLDGCLSYDMMDKYSIGNVLEKSILDIYSENVKVLSLKKTLINRV